MKPTLNLAGVILIIFGILALGYSSFTYTQREKVAEVGSLQITADKEKTVYFPPMLGGLSLVAGIVLVITGRLNR